MKILQALAAAIAILGASSAFADYQQVRTVNLKTILKKAGTVQGARILEDIPGRGIKVRAPLQTTIFSCYGASKDHYAGQTEVKGTVSADGKARIFYLSSGDYVHAVPGNDQVFRVDAFPTYMEPYVKARR